MGQAQAQEEELGDFGCCSHAEKSTSLRMLGADSLRKHVEDDEDCLPKALPSDAKVVKGVSASSRVMAQAAQPGDQTFSWEVSEFGNSPIASTGLGEEEGPSSPTPIVQRANSVCYRENVSVLERIEQKFPMYVTTAEQLLQLKSFIKHEDAVEKGLVHIAGKDRLTFFWSHQWLSYSHPDPNNVQLLCMQGVLSKVLREGVGHLFRDHTHKVSSSDVDQQLGMSESDFCTASRTGAHWIDYMSVPQNPSRLNEQQQAIMSIAAYASKSHVMMVLCPQSLHANTRHSCDLASWRKRGWCRLELIAMVWTHERFPIILCSGPDDCRIASELSPKKMSTSDAPCHGHFSCCENNHVKDNEEIKCDKRTVAQCLKQLHKIRVSAVLAQIGRGLEWRWAKAMLPVVLSGQTGSSDETLSESSMSLNDFLEDYTLKPGDMDEAQNTVLHWACFLGALEAVKVLISEKQTAAMINQSNCQEMRKPIHQYSLIAGGGVTPVMLASERGFTQVVQVLLKAEADVNARALYGATALNLAATRGYHNCVRELLTAGAEVDVPLNDEASFFGHCSGFTPLHSAVSAGHVNCAKLLLKAMANPSSCSRWGATPLHCAAALKDHVEMVHTLLLAKADPELECSASYPVEAWRAATPYDIANARDHCRSAALLQLL